MSHGSRGSSTSSSPSKIAADLGGTLINASSTGKELFLQPDTQSTLGVGSLLSCMPLSTPSLGSRLFAPPSTKLQQLLSTEMQRNHPDPPASLDQGEGHLFVCVHGLGGSKYDLRLYQLELTRYLPQATWLLSESNVDKTHHSCQDLAQALLIELQAAVDRHRPTHVSFLCHSLGSIIVRSMLVLPATRELLQLDETSPSRPRLHSFVSFAGPHLGVAALGNLVGTGMWFLARWHRSQSIPQLELKDARNSQDTHIWRLSQSSALTAFASVILIASPQDGYVPLESALLLPSQDRGRRTHAHESMRQQLLGPLLGSATVHVARVQVVFQNSPRSLAQAIGRAAHVGLLDNQACVRKILASQVHRLRRDSCA